MSKNTKTILIITVVVILVSVASYFIFLGKSKPKLNLDSFTKCLTDSGAKFYGASWCPHCKDQKEMFGSSIQYVPYIECSNEDATAQLQVCTDAKIEGYPTWVFADGSRQSGTIPLSQLAEKTGCALPQ